MSKTIRARLDIPSALGRMGRAASEGVPFRALEVLVADAKAALPDEAEQNTCTVYGTEHLRFEYDNHLTPHEELTMRVQSLEESQREARGLLPRDGEALKPEELARLRQLLGA